MKNIAKVELKNVSNISEEKIEEYSVSFNISNLSPIMIRKPNYSWINRNIAEELNLKVISCDYGADSYGCSFNPKLDKFINILEEKYGKVEYYNETLGFTLKLLFKADNKECIYFIGTGNNGQEVVTGVYLQDVKTLDNEIFRGTLCLLDEEMFNYLEDCNLKF